MFCRGGRWSFRSLVITFAGSLGGALILVFALRKCPGGHHAEHRNYQYICRISLIISAFSPHAKLSRRREKEMRRPRRQQDKCHVFSAEKSNKTGAENRTVSN